DSDTSVTAGPVNANGDLCTPAAPSIGTQTVPGSPVAIGISVYDTATLTGATSDAGGTVTYGLYSNNTCNVDHLVANLTPTPTANAVVDGVVPSSTSYSFTSAGIWYFQATYSGDSNNTGPVHSSCTSEAVVVSPNAPSIGTQTVPGSPVAIGISVYDTATLTGATSDAGGTVTYGLYSNNTCNVDHLVANLTPTPTANAVVDGVVPSSTSYSFTSAGIWYFQATYSGDSNNTGPVHSSCTSEAVVVSPNAPSIGTQTVPGSPVAIGISVYDTATLTGATSDAGGTVTYGLYSNNTCNVDHLVANLTPTPTANAVVDGVVPSSTSYSFTSAGIWYFQATYSGDSNNTGPVHSSCTSEAVVVSPNAPSIGTQTVPGSPVAIGISVYDTATLTGATSDAGGTVTYGLYSNNTCNVDHLVANLTPTPTANAVVDGVVPSSTSYSFTSAGIWYFQATYSGDSNNTGPVHSSCTSEAVVVSPNAPSIGTQTVPGSPVAIGISVYDTATLTGATSDAGGTVTYGLYSNNTCNVDHLVANLTPTPTANAVVDGVVPSSTSYSFTSAGIWYFQATYSGDSNNTGPVHSSCTSEAVVVSPNAPSIGTQTVPGSPVAIGISVYDTATLTGATSDAGGTVTYGLYSNNTCNVDHLVANLTPTPTANAVVDGVVPSSTSYSFTSAGIWYFQATYSGDSNNTGPVHSSCTSEAVVVSPNAPSIGTQTVPGSPVAIGISVYDTATLTGATSDAGGTVTYGLYSNNTCNVDHLVANLTPTPTANAVVDGVVPSSTSYSFTSAGIWYFQATYSGDSNNTGPV